MSSREIQAAYATTYLTQEGFRFTDEETLLASSIARSYALQYSESMRSVLMGRIRSQGEEGRPIG